MKDDQFLHPKHGKAFQAACAETAWPMQNTERIASAIARLGEVERKWLPFLDVLTKPNMAPGVALAEMHALDLDLARLKMIKAIDVRDGEAFGWAFGNSSKNLSAVLDASCMLQELGMFEAALLSALSSGKENHHQIPLTRIVCALTNCDPARMRQAGELLPEELGEPITAYRGVAGAVRARRIAGVSWTLDRERAEFFARRSARFAQCAAGEVYTLTVPRSRVLAYLGDREQEVIIVAKLSEIRSLAR